METTCDMMELCRLCLVKDEVNTPIFEEKGEIRQIFLKISSCLPVKVSREDKLPKKICDGCSCKLDMLYEFCNTSANAEKQLLTWLGQAGINANNTKTTDETMSAVVQMSNKPHETIVKQETIDTSDKEIEEGEETKHVSDPAYMFEQNFSFDDQASSSAGPSAHTNSDEPPPKRAKRAAALRALPITTETDEEDEDDVDAMEPLTKIEGESEESEGEDAEPSFVDAPSTSADDQPGPSGVGKGNIDAPWGELITESDQEDSKYQCGICGKLFHTKEKFLAHHMSLYGQQYTCCKCNMKFKSCTELYQHYDTHKMEVIIEQEGEVEELVLNYDNEEVIVQQPAITNEGNELLYILDDSHCVNEVVIEEEEPVMERPSKQESVNIVNLEHGYMMPHSMEEDEDEETYEEIQHKQIGKKVVITRKLSVQPSTSRRIFVQPKPRTPQPKRRHEVPDFSSTNYIFINANEEIEIPHYKCLRCEQLFINKFVFFRHIEKGKCYINNCDVCSATFSKNSDFYEHYAAEHTDRAICNFCFRTFMYEKNVKEHMLRHLDQFRHRCEDCNKGFYTVREYRNHYKNRHMGIRHKCEVCGRSFADEYYFKRHIATHAKASNITVLEITE